MFPLLVSREMNIETTSNKTRGRTGLFRFQMALRWYGAFASRRRVNAAGACATVLVGARGLAEETFQFFRSQSYVQ